MLLRNVGVHCIERLQKKSFLTGHCSNGQVNFSKCYFMNILQFTFSVVIGIFLFRKNNALVTRVLFS